MRKSALWLSIGTSLGIIISVSSFTLALLYLQIPVEIIPASEEVIALPVEEIKEEILKAPAEVQATKVTKEVIRKEKSTGEIKKKTLDYVDLINKLGTKTAKVAIILDDAGYTINGFIKLFFQTQAPLTFSVLPGLKYSKAIANLAYEHGMEVMLHMPMEYCGNSLMTDEDKLCRGGHNMRPYKYAILTGMSKETVEEELQQAINDIPHVKGVNNHMGSKVTSDTELMAIVLDIIKTKNLYFIDSLTTNRSVGYKIARAKGVLTNKRYVFLDNINDEKYVREQLWKLIYQAKRQGYAIGIGHATKSATAKVLAEMVPKLKEYGVEVVPASKLVY